ncbi:helix-turn-helix domain-containing protein [Halocynthiibacter sp. C4]|uniref:helix-turn-helix domain-containing protein n=1 Tax=Halocynthiibacter sp. C4 TaxID=2992758 RepID=UPI00237A2751|nr:helix-turn-helix domain-containing protein [Halocynthiibacter sp. C4]
MIDLDRFEQPVASPVSKRKLAEAEVFIEAHYNEPLKVADIAASIGISVRELQRAFKHYRGETPWDRHSRTRLRKARSQLLVCPPDTKVQDVALDCGFTHLGRFASYYHQSYNEFPSETLKRRTQKGGLR